MRGVILPGVKLWRGLPDIVDGNVDDGLLVDFQHATAVFDGGIRPPFWTEGILTPREAVVENESLTGDDRVGTIEYTRDAWDLVFDHRGGAVDAVQGMNVAGPAALIGHLLKSMGNGAVTLEIETTRRIHSLSATAAQSSEITVMAFQPGSLQKAASEQIDARLTQSQDEGISVETAKQIFAKQGGLAGQYQRNPQCWAADLDLTGTSPWNSGTTTQLGLTAISPIHVAGAHHAFAANGSTVVFVTASNQIVNRTLVSSIRVPGTDIRIGVLDTDLPTSIAFYPIMPATWEDTAPSWATNSASMVAMPMLLLDQEEKALVSDLGSIGSSFGLIRRDSHLPLRAPYHETILSGDSGNPGFIVLGGKLVLMTTHTTAFSGEFYGDSVAGINAAMTSLGGGYQLTHPRLTDFHHY